MRILRPVVMTAALVSTMACGGARPNTPPPPKPLVWQPLISSDGYFKYSGDLPGFAIEIQPTPGVVISRGISFAYDYSGIKPIPGGQVQRGVCQLKNRTSPRPLFWFFGDSSIADRYPSATPQEFRLYDVGNGVRGFSFTGSFGGHYAGAVPPDNYPVETVFYTDRECTDAGREFGFYRAVWEDKTYFYMSDFTNCEGDICRVDAAGTRDSSPRPEVSKVQIEGVTPGEHTYKAFVNPGGGSFHIEVDLLACSFVIEQTRITGPCAIDVPIGAQNPKSFYGYGDLENGYFNGQDSKSGFLATVLQVGNGAPQFTSDSQMTVSKLEVAR